MMPALPVAPCWQGPVFKWCPRRALTPWVLCEDNAGAAVLSVGSVLQLGAVRRCHPHTQGHMEGHRRHIPGLDTHLHRTVLQGILTHLGTTRLGTTRQALTPTATPTATPTRL
ncbi:protein S100-B isoform X1 [Numida meleagris]|uniref:protein S100-B isoform X1 n=1 Tax=Numida meleagris TaxID=8996 RepID=UPI000B3E1D44|nr:protein S100-B isoform X1 [Numida meleagris]